MHLKKQCILSSYFTFTKLKLFFSSYINKSGFVPVVNLISKINYTSYGENELEMGHSGYNKVAIQK